MAGRMTRFALDPCFTPAGTLTQQAGTHGHSVNALVAGMADLALVTHDAGLLQRVKAIFDVYKGSDAPGDFEKEEKYHEIGESILTYRTLRNELRYLCGISERGK